MFKNRNNLAILQEFYEEHNKLRQSPKSFIPALQDRISRLDKQGRIVVGPGIKVKTEEGEKAILEAIEFLEEIVPIENCMLVSKALWEVAQLHADDMGNSGLIGHSGSAGDGVTERFEEFIKNSKCKGENIIFTKEKSARDYLIDLLIDDGVKDRSHRMVLFCAYFDSFGVGMADHDLYGKWIVINYGQEIVPIKEGGDIIDMEVDYFKEVPEHLDGLLENYFKKKFKRAYTMETKYSKSPRTSSPVTGETRERKNSHADVPLEPIEKHPENHESNIIKKSN